MRVPPAGTRPTSARVREALFSAVVSRIDLDDARVLDLYAGSGALGLEALSRGAVHLLAVESNPKAGAVLKANVGDLGLSGAVVRIAPVAAVLAGNADTAYDVVFSDPPYAVDDDAIQHDLALLLRNGWVAPDSIVVLERSSRSPDTLWPSGYAPIRVRKYGDTKIEMSEVTTPV